ncbi:MAG: hypothetical protein ABR572_13305 [Cryomorphaceae bacterium]
MADHPPEPTPLSVRGRVENFVENTAADTPHCARASVALSQT